ncbi:RluA family pseudouridine synthase [Altererythrobacter ishigakiensis]|uniref:tRNA pseudouridine32 synthase / 23S rRNA pseudouridine746 synthase n=1 Tax=Altererythrobacter ishigakiensis TaxID=476157 RepID=A0A562UTF0_9SPHN|nr:RNA pseudouridine synthase [Altererythrobacter ishigakiensis]TWJ08867.1 tRNA pseudouridine32 synthase / 23S rRNA pseudouridine746 synthase [Altererythrobacter ishigakiensis]
MNIEILFEDGEALVINKPAGLPVDRPKRGGPALWDHIEQLKLGFQRPPVAVHRLDTDTSGCLILARNPKALKRFNKAFEDRLVGKTYLAVMDFEPSEQSGTIELNLAKISSAEKGWRMIAAKKGKPAISHWELLQTIGEGDRKRSLIRFRPETGRTHQLRVHALQGLGVPLLGDPVYGPVRGQNKGAPRTMLHAEAIHMTRPGKDPVSAYAPFPEDFIRAGLTAPEPPPPPIRIPVSDDG